jgi:hypothetical protein
MSITFDMTSPQHAVCTVLYCHKHVTNSVGGGGACQYDLDKVIGGRIWKLIVSGEETTSLA